MIRPIADQLREYAKTVAEGSSTYCEAPIMLLERAASLLEGETDRQMCARIYGDEPIDATGWAEAAFCDDVDPAQREFAPNNFAQNALNSYNQSIGWAAANFLPTTRAAGGVASTCSIRRSASNGRSRQTDTC